MKAVQLFRRRSMTVLPAGNAAARAEAPAAPEQSVHDVATSDSGPADNAGINVKRVDAGTVPDAQFAVTLGPDEADRIAVGTFNRLKQDTPAVAFSGALRAAYGVLGRQAYGWASVAF